MEDLPLCIGKPLFREFLFQCIHTLQIQVPLNGVNYVKSKVLEESEDVSSILVPMTTISCPQYSFFIYTISVIFTFLYSLFLSSTQSFSLRPSEVFPFLSFFSFSRSDIYWYTTPEGRQS